MENQLKSLSSRQTKKRIKIHQIHQLAYRISFIVNSHNCNWQWMVGRVWLHFTGVERKGHAEVMSRHMKVIKNTILCLPTWFMRELSVIYDCSWIIQSSIIQVSQVALRYPRSTRVVIAPSDFPFGFSPSDKSLFNSPFPRTKIECQKWPNIVVWNYALNWNKFTWLWKG